MQTLSHHAHPIIRLVLFSLVLFSAPAAAQTEANFSSGTQPARQYGMHEIVLRGDGSVANPFDTRATITFTPPSGAANAITVDLFYDGEDVWRGRVYVSEAGEWAWATASEDDALLDGQGGVFSAEESDLRGMLRQHPDDPKQWATDDGQWFLNLSDTAYRLFEQQQTRWRDYVQDAAEQGITSLRSGALGGWEWLPAEQGEFGASNYPWDGDDLTRFNLEKFQTTDKRLQWMLNNFPDMYVQMILFGQIHWETQEAGEAWASVPPEIREQTMRYMIARWAAYPQLFWLTANDLDCSPNLPLNRAYTLEVGRYFAAHDPWGHLLSAGPARDQPFCFTEGDEAEWVSYIHLEGSHELDAQYALEYEDIPLHVFFGEDYYEQEHPTRSPENPAYFQRWLYWSWLLAGGSANYGGRYWVIHPYDKTGILPFEHRDMKYGALKGLDSVPHIPVYFEERGLDLVGFVRDDGLARNLSGENDVRRPRVAYRGDLDEVLVYHPNARSAGARATVRADVAASLSIDLSEQPYRYSVEWYRAADGAAEMGEALAGGAVVQLSAPWVGADVVLRLVKQDALPHTPTPAPMPEGDTVLVVYTFDEGEGSVVHDVSGVGRALDLEIAEMAAVSWGAGFLSVDAPTQIVSSSAANKIIEAARATNALTVEAWLRPDNLTQDGPARIISLSPNIRERSFTLGQDSLEEQQGSRYVMRLRTSETDANGIPALVTTASTVSTELTHVVYTRAVNGEARLYVNGEEVASGRVPGDFTNWPADWPLVLANEVTGERPWLGEYHFVAIYNYALDAAQVSAKFAAGAEQP